MSLDLRSRLELYKKGEIRNSSRHASSGKDIHDLLPGCTLNNDNGSCYLIEKKFPLAWLHGGISLGSALDVNLSTLNSVFYELSPALSIKDFLFLDTETTGLSGGAGTVAFLVGTGFFEEDCFTVRQYFMRDYDEEPSLLSALDSHWKAFAGVVTFNGKAFDMNLLSSRFIFNRIRPGLKNPVHMDLLYPSRRIWKLKLESCRLSSLEENILGEYRVDDIPGALIPSVYFKYLEDRNASEIIRVINHNEKDILSMVSLLYTVAMKLEDPASADGEELFGLGRIFETQGEYNKGIECFETCARSDVSRVKEMASKKLSEMYKRKGDYESAVRHWNGMLSEKGTLSLFPLIELAKYYEHKIRDFESAIAVVEKAISVSSGLGLLRSVEMAELRKRYDRLKKKTGRYGNG